MPTGAFQSKVDKASAWLKSRGVGSPRLAVVMGSGLAGALQIPDPRLSAGFSDIPGFSGPSVAGHPGRLVSGSLYGLDLALFEGRIHMYEGSGEEALRLVAGVMAGIGVQAVLLTSACGGLSATLRPGDFVVVWDHLGYPLGGRAAGLVRLVNSSLHIRNGFTGVGNFCLQAGDILVDLLKVFAACALARRYKNRDRKQRRKQGQQLSI